MTLTELSDIIRAKAETLPDILYLRATDTQANIDLDNVEIKGKTVVLFNNLPDISHAISRSGAITQEIPIEIKVMQLADVDDMEHQSDTIRDYCYQVANRLFDLLSREQTLPDTFQYDVRFLGETKLYDKVMTGVRLVFTIYSDRRGYGC